MSERTGTPTRVFVARLAGLVVFEDRTPRRNLDHQTQHPWLLMAEPEHDDDVAHPADLVAVRVEHDKTGQARDENPRRGSAALGHVAEVIAPSPCHGSDAHA